MMTRFYLLALYFYILKLFHVVVGISISPQVSKRLVNSCDNLPKIRTLLIDNYDSYTYNIWQCLSDINKEQPVVVFNDDFDCWDKLLENVPPFHNIVISPGPGRPDIHSDFGLSLDAIRKTSIPLLGVCLGHQGMAHAYGGVVKKAKEPMHGRKSRLHHKNMGLFKNILQHEQVVRYHSLVVEEPLPPELFATAWTADGTIMGLQHTSLPQFGVQFHPESIATESGYKVFSNFYDITHDFYASAPHAGLMSSSSGLSSSPQKYFSFIDQAKYIMCMASSDDHGSIYNTYNTANCIKETLNTMKDETNEKVEETVQLGVHITKLDIPRSLSYEDIFRELYGEQSSSFWLDSSSNLQHTPILQSKESSSSSISSNIVLSFMGAMDAADSYTAEYWGDNRLHIVHHDNSEIKYHGPYSSKIETLDLNIFEFLENQLEKGKQQQIVTDSTCSIDELPFSPTASLFGFLGYEARHDASNILRAAPIPTTVTVDGIPSGFKYNLAGTHMKTDDSKQTNVQKAASKLHQVNSTLSLDKRDVTPTTPVSVFIFPTRFLVLDHNQSAIYIVTSSGCSPSGSTRSRDDSARKCDIHGTSQHVSSSPLQPINDIITKLQGLIQKQNIHSPSCSHNTSSSVSFMQYPNISKSSPESDLSVDKIDSGLTDTKKRSQYRRGNVLKCDKSEAQYIEDVDKCLDYIRQGETYEVCLTVPFRGSCREPPIEVYSALRSNNPAPYSAYFRYVPVASRDGVLLDSNRRADEGFSVCCSSPERYLKASSDGYLESKPIKGTVKRVFDDEQADAEAAVSLQADEKSVAENLMIVDLVRNDFGRVCEAGSVSVPSLMHVESYKSVHQLVSTIRGRLAPGRSLTDAIVASFPGGSMTGAPKRRTMDIIHELEQGRPRGVYSGAIGYIGLNGVADLNIVIRTALIQNNEIVINAGGAIVAMSSPEKELQEILLKARAVSASIGYELQMGLHDERSAE